MVHTIKIDGASPFHATLFAMGGVPHLHFDYNGSAVQITSEGVTPASAQMSEWLALARDPETSNPWAALQDEGEWPEVDPRTIALNENKERLRVLHADPHVIAKKARLEELTGKLEMVVILCDAQSDNAG